MNIIIESSLKTLQKSKFLISKLKDDSLSDATIGPYYSGIGAHLRHILDFYDCVLNISSNNEVDLTARSRNKEVESCCNTAKSYLDSVMDRVEVFDKDMKSLIYVTDDLGLGKTEIEYTLGALFAQANSHAIHHYAIINYILEGLKISFKDPDFGYNPTTPKSVSLN